MSKMGFCIFTDGSYATEVVAPKADCSTKEEFLKEAHAECDGYDWEHKLTIENIQEGHCRYYPVAPEGCDFDGGCYSFSKQGSGAFPVWYISLSR
ncbi:hypothetical protein E1B06_14955 [Brevibacillus laterosporus]|uniref:hypothetical protein n=1 Tax=Brevibacillus laterosporus TaxID=1465 RepID=UPI002406694A|nr:hypothetical protein [Brevibacillus laterosporus]MDF9412982.1 hypothetical protein [Brevibacillus laterosporus]